MHGCGQAFDKQGPRPYSIWQLNQLSEHFGYNYRSASQRRSKPAILSSNSAAHYHLRQLEFPSISAPQTSLSLQGFCHNASQTWNILLRQYLVPPPSHHCDTFSDGYFLGSKAILNSTGVSCALGVVQKGSNPTFFLFFLFAHHDALLAASSKSML